MIALHEILYLHGTYAVLTCNVPRSIDVTLQEIHIRVLLGECFKSRRDRMTRAAPVFQGLQYSHETAAGEKRTMKRESL